MKRLWIILFAVALCAACSRQTDIDGAETAEEYAGLTAKTDTAFASVPAGPKVSAAPTPSSEGPLEESLSQMWDLANTLYINSDYAGAAAVYDSIVDAGYESAKLWYNLGNARFKEGAIGHAIADYSRALRLSPSDPDIRYNLSVAGSYAKDRIEAVPEFFLSAWVKGVRSMLGSNVWAALSLVFLGIMLALVLVYLLAEKKAARKSGFFGAVAAALLFTAAAGFASAERRTMLDTSEGVVTASSVSVKSSPDKSGRDLFILHEGTKVKVTGRLGDWAEVALADGNKGWLRHSALEMINPAEIPAKKP